jgi:hypothetical protein
LPKVSSQEAFRQNEILKVYARTEVSLKAGAVGSQSVGGGGGAELGGARAAICKHLMRKLQKSGRETRTEWRNAYFSRQLAFPFRQISCERAALENTSLITTSRRSGGGAAGGSGAKASLTL